MTKIVIASDHAGFALKASIMQYFENEIQFTDLGCYSKDSVDYPDFAHPLAQAINNKTFALGILICGSANGVAIVANKYANVRAAICWEKELATLARNHNDANVLCLPARFISQELAFEIVSAFLQTSFEGGRHQNRVNKISCC